MPGVKRSSERRDTEQLTCKRWQWLFSQCASSSITWELGRNADSQVPPRPAGREAVPPSSDACQSLRPWDGESEWPLAPWEYFHECCGYRVKQCLQNSKGAWLLSYVYVSTVNPIKSSPNMRAEGSTSVRGFLESCWRICPRKMSKGTKHEDWAARQWDSPTEEGGEIPQSEARFYKTLHFLIMILWSLCGKSGLLQSSSSQSRITAL